MQSVSSSLAPPRSWSRARSRCSCWSTPTRAARSSTPRACRSRTVRWHGVGSGGVEATWEHSSRGKAPTVHALAFRHDASTTSTMHHGGPSAIPSVGGHWNNWCLLPSARWEMPYREQVQPQRSRFRQRQWRMSKVRVIVFAPRAGEARGPRRALGGKVSVYIL